MADDDRLRDAERICELLATTVAHDLRNPLAALHTGIAVLRQGQLGERERSVLERLNRAGERMARVLDQATLIATRELELDRSAARLGDVCRAAIHRVERGAREVGITDDLADPIEIDAIRIGQLVESVLAHVLRYSDGPIAVRIARDGDGAVIAFQAQVRPRDSLDLAVAERVVRAHGGSHTTDGAGITFRIPSA
jgi:sigma-B regulation protein RsbU (phosphoserine phosphatase)